MYEKHSSFEPPENENEKIWRFMDFAKFVDVLINQSLYFCRTDLMNDPFEGRYTPHMIDVFSKEARDEQEKQRIREFLIQDPHECRHTSFLNCWYMGDVEPASMWKLYTSSNQGIVIQSTFKRLINSFANNSKFSIFIGKVRYIDYKEDTIPLRNVFSPLLYKRHHFEHEQELRAVVVDIEPMIKGTPFSMGHLVETNLEELVEGVRIAPTSSDWFKKIVKTLTQKFDLDVIITNSELDEKPPVI